MRIATWNVNSLKARLPRVEEWLEYAQPDVLCIQETKLADAAFPAMAFQALGYDAAHHGNGRWNGVAILSRVGLEDVVAGFSGEREDEIVESRFLSATCGGVRVSSVYVPNGRAVGTEHYEAKLMAPATELAGPPVSAGYVGLDRLSGAERAAWAALADRALEPNPFFRPEFVLAAARGASPTTLARVRQGERWIACVPLGAARRWRRVPLPCLAPWRPDYAFLATPLVDRDAVVPATQALARLLTRRARVAAVVLDPLPVDGPVGGALDRALRAAGHSPITYAAYERAVLRRRPTPTYLDESLSTAGRKQLRKRRRGLARELGGDVTVVDRSGDPAAPAEFLAMELASWKGEAGTALASDPADAAFFAQMCAAMASQGRLHVLTLEAAGTTVAMQVNLFDGDAAFGFKVAYDARFGRFSPGTLLEVEAIERFHERGIELVDSCAAADNALMNRLWPDRRAMRTVLIPTRAPGARLLGPALAAEAAARRLRDRLRPAPAAHPPGG